MQRGEKRSLINLIKAIYVRVLQVIAYNSFPPALTAYLHKLRGVKVGKRVFIGRNVYIDDKYPNKVIIGNNVLIAVGTIILAHKRDISNYLYNESPYNYPFKSGSVIISDNVQIGTGAIIMPDIKIGKGSIIGAGSVVTKDIPEGCLAIGVPAKVIKNYMEVK